MANLQRIKSTYHLKFCAAALLLVSASLVAQDPQTTPPPAEAAQQGGPDTIGGGVQDPAAVERGRKSSARRAASAMAPTPAAEADPIWFALASCFTIRKVISSASSFGMAAHSRGCPRFRSLRIRLLI